MAGGQQWLLTENHTFLADFRHLHDVLENVGKATGVKGVAVVHARTVTTSPPSRRSNPWLARGVDLAFAIHPSAPFPKFVYPLQHPPFTNFGKSWALANL